ncbi:MAG: hypothetical protein M1827_007161 [Pycnora praestabilis]|nr:MAG: hypothetical protein M1827_007161 [Pycnora praestabilis]
MAARRDIDRLGLSKYEHLSLLSSTTSEAKEIQHRSGPLKCSEETPGRVWMTRRRHDGKLLLAQEFKDSHCIIDETKETLLRLLNHPNLVRLLDVVCDTDIAGGKTDYTVWEYCDKGTLSHLLSSLHGPYKKDQTEIPDSLCWHVLDGISQALLWLHTGYKDTFPFDRHMAHDDDWQPVLIGEISPASSKPPISIYFCAPKGNETYGTVKLGGFGSASILASEASQVSVSVTKPTTSSMYEGKYTPPEIRNNTHSWSPPAEIWCLGAILYHMMFGQPPADTERDLSLAIPHRPDQYYHYVKPLPRRYSPELTALVYEMLRFRKEDRPSAPDLAMRVPAGLRIWRDKVGSKAAYVRTGERR